MPDKALFQMLAAKNDSDQGQYKAKADKMFKLLMTQPDEFEVEDDPKGGHPLLTHRPTHFKMHLPKRYIPARVWDSPHEALVSREVIDKEKEASTKEDRAVPAYVAKQAGLPRSVKMIPYIRNYADEGMRQILSRPRWPATLREPLPWGNFAAYAPEGTNAYNVIGSDIPKVLQGMGYGRKMYGAAIRTAYEDYLKGGPRWFGSDSSGRTTTKAWHLWESLQRRGYPAKQMPMDFPRKGYHSRWAIDLDDMKKFYKDVKPNGPATGKPVTRVGPPVKEASVPSDKQLLSQTDLNPSEAQQEAGNYRKAHIKLHGLDISIENPRGSTRSGVGPDGKEWSHKLDLHYGYIKGFS